MVYIAFDGCDFAPFGVFMEAMYVEVVYLIKTMYDAMISNGVSRW